MEITILRWIQENMRSPLPDKLMIWISYSGELGLVWILFALLLIFLPAWRKYRRLGFTMLISLALGGITCNLLLKPIIARPRPFIHHPHDYPHLVSYPSEFSFPSGHSTSSWAATGVLFRQFPPWRWLPFLYAFLMSFSRLYLFVHYPSDVVVGFCLGLLNSYLAHYLVTVLEKYSPQIQTFLTSPVSGQKF